MTVGIGAPFSSSCVAALNALQNSMMLTPRWPSAGPIGGEGLAMPAGTCSLMYPVIFFAIVHSEVRRSLGAGGSVQLSGPSVLLRTRLRSTPTRFPIAWKAAPITEVCRARNFCYGNQGTRQGACHDTLDSTRSRDSVDRRASGARQGEAGQAEG